MKHLLARNRRRTGAIAPLTALLIVPLMGMMAFAIDVSYLILVQTELQNAADAAALAGAEKLQALYVQYYAPGQSSSGQSSIYNSATGNDSTWNSPTYTAEQYAGYNQAGGVHITVPDTDVTFWYKDGNFAPQPASYPNQFPNTVTVVTRRDHKYNTPVSLFFGPIFGVNTIELTATASATIYAGDVTTLQAISGVNAHILPVALDVNIWKYFLGTGKSWDGTFDSNGNPNGTTDNGPNGLPQLDVYPTTTNTPGSFGLLDVGPPQNNAPAFRNWIDDGETPNDIQYLINNNLVPVSASTDHWWKCGPGLKSTLLTNFQNEIGNANLIPLFKPVSTPTPANPGTSYQAATGSGQGATYDIIGFAGVKISSATGSGQNMNISIQPMAVIDPTAVIGSPVPATKNATSPLTGSGSTFTTFVSAKLTQ